MTMAKRLEMDQVVSLSKNLKVAYSPLFGVYSIPGLRPPLDVLSAGKGMAFWESRKNETLPIETGVLAVVTGDGITNRRGDHFRFFESKLDFERNLAVFRDPGQAFFRTIFFLVRDDSSGRGLLRSEWETIWGNACLATSREVVHFIHYQQKLKQKPETKTSMIFQG